MAPDYFDACMCDLWGRACESLEELGTLHKIDFDLLEQYVFLLGSCRSLAKEIATEGTTQIYINNDGAANRAVNPKVRVHKDNLTMANRLANDLGITPKSRKIISGAVKSVKQENLFDQI